MDISLLYDRYRAGTLDPNLYQGLLSIKQEFDKQRNTVKAIAERAFRENWGAFRLSTEAGKALEPLLEKYLPEVEKLMGNPQLANAIVEAWVNSASYFPELRHLQITPSFSQKYNQWLTNNTKYRYNFNQETLNQIRDFAQLRHKPVSMSSNQEIADLQKQIAQLQAELQKTRSAPQPEATIQPSQPQQVGNNWELPEEGLLQTGEFATQLAKQRQQQDANLMASGLTRQQILQQRGSENIVRELGLSKMIAEQRRKSIQDWLQTVGGLQQQVRPPDFSGLREMASAFQQGTSAQQQMMMKLFENLMRQGGSQ